MQIEFGNDAILVDAATIAEGLGLDPEIVRQRMREGRITSLCERGTEEDEGRFRLTFFSDNCRFGLVVSETGEIIQRLRLNFGNRPLPAAAHNPGR